MGQGKNRLFVCFAGICAFLMISAGASPGLASTGRGYTVVSQTERTLTFTVDLPAYRLEEIAYEGGSYLKPVVTGYAPFALQGSPDLPVFTVLVAVPPGGDASIASFTRSDERVLQNMRVAPVPGILARGDGPEKFADYVFREGDAYQSAAPYPAAPVWLDQRGRMRHQDVVRVYVSPFIYEPARNLLRVAGSTTVTVSIEGVGAGGTGSLIRGAMPGDAWEDVYGELLVNYEQGKAWRTAAFPALRSQAVTNNRVKFLIDETGMHAVDFATLSDAGFPDGVPVDDLFMYRDWFSAGGPGLPDTVNTVELAIQVTDEDGNGVLSGDDRISFYGLNFYDQFGWQGGEDYFFDRNVCWLSWGGGGHLRMGSKDGWIDAVSPGTPPGFTDFVHVEKDSLFINFPPGGDPMDFYTWRVFSSSIPFDMPGLDESAPVNLVAQFISYYNIPGGLSRVATIDVSIQGCEGPMNDLASFSVSVPSVAKREFPVESGLLCEEGNTFRFESRLPSNWTPGNTLDWLEAFYRRRYEAAGDMLIFTSGGMKGELEFEIEGFSGSDILLFDVTDSLAPVSVDVPPERIVPGGGGYTLTFLDSIADEHRYIALRPPAEVLVAAAQVEYLPPPLLRDAEGDYALISHPDFASEMDDLVSLREAQGHTVIRATIDEVYNDFGNGIKSDEAIKRFVRNAFYNGGTEFVLLVGDANVDRRGLLLDPPLPPPPPAGRGQYPSDVDYLPSHNLYLIDGNPPNREIRPNDNWYVTLDGDADPYPDLYIGRLPVGNTQEAEGAVAKILNYENYQGQDPWKKRMIVVADDFYRDFCYYSIEHSFEQACDSAAIIANDFSVVAPDTVRYFLERCTRDDQPEKRELNQCVTSFYTQNFTRSNCTPELRSLLNSGAFCVNYQGHANRQQFTHETLIKDYDTYTTDYRDIRDLSNFQKPFMFFGFGCWMSDFQVSSEGADIVGDAIGERFVINPDGAASACFASACGEYISDNRDFNPFVTRAVFSHLKSRDPFGNPIPARVLAGEAVITALVRFAARPPGHTSFAQKHVYLGDPAMVMDMGPPLIEVAINDSTIDETYVFTGEASDTLHIESIISDEEAIMALGVGIAEGGAVMPVDPADYETAALVDPEYTRSRSYELIYDHVPRLGNYAVRISAGDYAEKVSTFDVNVNTGSASYFKNNDPLEEGGLLVIGQHMRILLGRANPFASEDIKVVVDTIPAENFQSYNVEIKDAEGKQWEVSFAPSLSAGDHTVRATVQGLTSSRVFSYVPARVEYFVGEGRLYDNDFVSGSASYRVLVVAEAGLSEDDIALELNGEPLAADFEPDSTGTSFEADLELDLDAGSYELSAVIFEFRVPVSFVVSDVLELKDVSVYPSPFPQAAYFYYTLSQDAREARLEIYTVSGRKIFDADLPLTAGYNEFRWDGRDVAGDRIANGTYLYKIVAKSASSEKEFTGWVVKVE